MMPPPITSIFFGRLRNSSAPVESTILGSSGKNGKETGTDPAAMIAFSNLIVLEPPSSVATRI